MRSRLIIGVLLLAFTAAAASGQQASSVAYAGIVDYLVNQYGIDPNAGLVAMPSLKVPMGGRSEALGTAFAAVADDASFLEWNPAGSASLGLTELAFFHNNWVADAKMEGAVFTMRRGDLGLSAGGKWLYLPFTETDSFGNRASKGYYAETTAIVNASYNFLAGYYFTGVSLGASVKGSFRSMPDYADNDGQLVAGSGAAQSAGALMLDLGALTRFNAFKFYHARERNAAAALVLRNFGFPARGEALPTQAVFALAYRPVRPVQLSFDLELPINLVDWSLSELPTTALGVSAALTDFLGLQAGVQLKAGRWALSVGTRLALTGIKLDLNYTLDLLTQPQSVNRLSLAASFDFGDSGRAEIARRVDELYLNGLEEYANGNTETALAMLQEALKLDPKFDPAREAVAALLVAQALVQRIDQIQKLE
jgi:hypothetical protein